MAKKKKKWKSRIKKALKLAAIGGAGYLAAKAFGGKKGPVSTVGQPTGVGRVADKPAHLGEGVARPYQDDIMHGGLGSSGWPDERKWYQKIFKKGGRVTGIAKRGFGRALMKGKR